MTDLVVGSVPRIECEHVFVLIVCVLIPRFELAVAAGGREALAAGPGRAGARGGARAVHRRGVGGRRGATACAPGCGWGRRSRAARRCGSWRPTPPGWPTSGIACWRALEGIGAAVEPGRPGLAWFDSDGLRNLHGGSVEGVIAAAARASAAARPARLASAAPSRFAALAAASERPRPARRDRALRPGPAGRLPGAAAGRPARLRGRRRPRCPETLERFGIRTLGELAKLPRAALADRFGAAGPLARDLARGRDTPLRPRRAAERLEERLELPESASGPAARARARPAHRPAARPPRAARPPAARRRARRAGWWRAGPGARA